MSAPHTQTTDAPFLSAKGKKMDSQRRGRPINEESNEAFFFHEKQRISEGWCVRGAFFACALLLLAILLIWQPSPYNDYYYYN